MHTNLGLLATKRKEQKEGSPKMWDIRGDVWDSFDRAGSHEVHHCLLMNQTYKLSNLWMKDRG